MLPTGFTGRGRVPAWTTCCGTNIPGLCHQLARGGAAFGVEREDCVEIGWRLVVQAIHNLFNDNRYLPKADLPGKKGGNGDFIGRIEYDRRDYDLFCILLDFLLAFCSIGRNMDNCIINWVG